MSLATRCTACGTVFRVVQDQLKVSEGWVRCGRCKEVFNAIEGLFDLEPVSRPAALDAGPTTTAPGTASLLTTEDAAAHARPADRAGHGMGFELHRPDAEAAHERGDLEDAGDVGGGQAPIADAPRSIPAHHHDREGALGRGGEHDPAGPVGGEPSGVTSDSGLVTEAQAFALLPAGESRDGAYAGPAAAADSEAAGDSRDFADARFPSELPLDSRGELLMEEAPAPATEEHGATPAPAAADASDDLPSFLQQGRRAEAGQRRGERAALAVAALALALGLAAQGALQWRDMLAAEHPALRPALVAACESLGCRIEPPRRIEDIAVESSSLMRASGAGEEALQLQVALRNRGPLALALPAIDLSLTDATGELVARRALPVSAFRGAGPSLPPASETSLQLLLANPGARVAGYSVAVFYP